eukprot:2095563-Heterocapsa_arctica.AAC.1
MDLLLPHVGALSLVRCRLRARLGGAGARMATTSWPRVARSGGRALRALERARGHRSSAASAPPSVEVA